MAMNGRLTRPHACGKWFMMDVDVVVGGEKVGSEVGGRVGA